MNVNGGVEIHYGKRIAAAEMKDEVLTLLFDDGSGVRMSDQGQSCCEYRHMSTDDDLQEKLVGNLLMAVRVKDGPEPSKGDTEDWEHEIHETEFLEISSSGGFVTMVNHNEHNGYYEGFAIKMAHISWGVKTA